MNKNKDFHNPERRTIEDRAIIERTKHGVQLLQGAFDAVLNRPDVAVVLDVGAGDTEYADFRQKNYNQDVVRADPDYAYDPPEGESMFVNDSACDLSSFEADTFGAVISSFMMQHLSKDDQRAALYEMIRVAAGEQDGQFGYIGIYPVYDERKMQNVLRPLDVDAGVVAYDNQYAAKGAIAVKALEFPTLWIKKSPDLTPEIQAVMVDAIVQSGALDRRKGISDRRRRKAMVQSGSNRVEV
ncbi:MAG: class I SAM-dependent methyltransferase [Candidatus Saccharimonadales bacterium]